MFGIIQNVHEQVLGRMFPYKTLTIDIIQLMTNLMIFSGDYMDVWTDMLLSKNLNRRK